MRAILMLLGIPFHSALAFSGENWVVTAPTSTPTLAGLAEFLHVWRMPTFFMIAGFFATLMLDRYSEAAWLRMRAVRLGIPLIFGMLLLSPLQWLLAGYYRADGWEGAIQFALSKLWPPSSWWTMHLWFLVELLVYCVALALIYRFVGRARLGSWSRTTFAQFDRRPTIAVACAAIGAGVAVVLGLAAWQAVSADELLSGLLSRNLPIFAPAFFLGCLLGADGANRLSSVNRVSIWMLGTFATVAIACVIMLKVVVGAESNTALAAVAFMWTVGGLTTALLCLRVARGLLDRSSRVVRVLVDSSLVVYLVHQPLILAAAIFAKGASSVPWLSWALTVILVLGVSLGIYEAINRIKPLRWMFTGSTRRGASFLGGISDRALTSGSRRPQIVPSAMRPKKDAL
jgi:glucan biosynthesis protein C